MAKIVRFSELKPRTIRAAIVALTQHNLLWHVELEDEGEVLEFNSEECLMRLRFGRFISLAGKIMGQAVSLFICIGYALANFCQAAHVLSIVLENGKLRQPDILEKLRISDVKGIVIVAWIAVS